MQENYEEIVARWYLKLQPAFTRNLRKKYPLMSLADAEDIYQEAFIAINSNLEAGKIKEETVWANYIATICNNLATHRLRRLGINDSIDDHDEDKDKDSGLARKVESLISLAEEDEDIPYYRDEEAKQILERELTSTPEPCASIIRMYYYEGASMKDIATATGLRNSDTAKSRKLQCMKQLMKKMETALLSAGIRVNPVKKKK